MPRRTAFNCLHTDRPVRARGLCGSCYVVSHRRGFDSPARDDYIEEVIDLADIRAVTWDTLEDTFGRERSHLQAQLRRYDRADLVKRIHFNTYGVITQPDIISVVNRRNQYGRDVLEPG